MYEKGYFRDSYNATSLMWRYEFSWWEGLPVDGHKAMDEEGNISPVECSRLAEWFRENPVPELVPGELSYAEDSETVEGCAGWDKFFEKKRQNWIKILDQAVELDESLNCSC